MFESTPVTYNATTGGWDATPAVDPLAAATVAVDPAVEAAAVEAAG